MTTAIHVLRLLVLAALIGAPLAGLRAENHNPDECVEPPATIIKWDPEPIHKFMDPLTAATRRMPHVKEFTWGILAPIDLEIGEECCPGASSPTLYWKASLNLVVRAKCEWWLPGGSLVGTIWYDRKTPGWFGTPKQIVAGNIKWGLGFFGGGEGRLGFFSSPVKVVSNCGNCVVCTVGGEVTGKVGLGGQIEWWCIVMDRYRTEGRINAEMSLSTGFSVKGGFRVGSLPNCDGVWGDLCWDGLWGDLRASLKIKGIGTFSFTRRLTFFDQGCISFGLGPGGWQTR